MDRTNRGIAKLPKSQEFKWKRQFQWAFNQNIIVTITKPKTLNTSLRSLFLQHIFQLKPHHYRAVREHLVQLMFEKFNGSDFYAAEQPVVSLYAADRISGCTVDVGHGEIDIAPVIEGAAQHIASRRFDIGGAALTSLLIQKLSKSNPLVNLNVWDVEKLKEQYASCQDEVIMRKPNSHVSNEKHTRPMASNNNWNRKIYKG
ncbi:hypothetical protein Nepgr_028156 [Nepenthes gracilis]|uniref:Uncharacterized protein n=1 Tax=Nepenthes gracilis TaxID=150966 RepID=A0AAD3TA46_NEPGR|nr:hypothetical protein Nepgr_028156 [Nepenthes gracilis]